MPIPHSPETVTTRDGTALTLHRWRPAPDIAPRGCIVIAHGLGEHGGRYASLAGDLTRHGWEVMAFDHRGHGASPGLRGTLPRPDAMELDIRDVLAFARASAPGPTVLLGHSMGGAFAANVIAKTPDAADALVLSSPALRAHLSWAQRFLLRLLLSMGPGAVVGNGLKPKWLSHDPAVVEAYRTDPLVHDRVSARLISAMIASGGHALAAAARWQTPTLLLWAGDDRLVDAAGSAEFAAAAPESFVTARRFPTLYHEIFNETERQAPVSALLEWLALRT